MVTLKQIENYSQMLRSKNYTWTHYYYSIISFNRRNIIVVTNKFTYSKLSDFKMHSKKNRRVK